MSIKVMTMVFDRYPAGGNERLLALALADHSRDDGSRIWPSIDELARKTVQSRRTVQRQIANMVERGWLESVRDGGGRGVTNEYRINPAWVAGDPLASEVMHKGVNLTPFPEDQKGVTGDQKGVTSDAKGVTAMTPESSEPSEPSISPLPPKGGATHVSVDNSKARAIGFEAVYAAYPNKANRVKAQRRWLRLGPDKVLQAAMLAAISLQVRSPKWTRDGGQFIPELSTWLRNAAWRDDAEPPVMGDWWTTTEGVMAMGERQGRPFSLADLGNAYTDDQRVAHWRVYRAKVLAAAGDGPWAERRAA